MIDLTVQELRKSFGSVPVLDGVDLHVPAGSLTAVLGPSGCGKTTLLRLIAGFDRPDAGSIRLGDQVVYERGRFVPPEQRGAGYVAQEGALFPHLTVARNITFGLPWRERRRNHHVEELLRLVDLDPIYARRYPHELSGGQQQRVAVARALAPGPALVLLDEPFSSLDAGLREGTRRAVKDALIAARATAILVTHDQAEALSLADRVAVMRQGRIVQAGTPEEVYRRPADVAVGTFVGEAVVLPATLRRGVAECALGCLPVETVVEDGPVDLLIRPEQINIHAAHEPDSIAATVTGSVYHGHHASVQLRLPGGEQITARTTGFTVLPIGERVYLSVTGPVHAVPAGDGAVTEGSL